MTPAARGNTRAPEHDSGKWKLEIIWLLHQLVQRLGELRRARGSHNTCSRSSYVSVRRMVWCRATREIAEGSRPRLPPVQSLKVTVLRLGSIESVYIGHSGYATACCFRNLMPSKAITAGV